MADRPVRFLYPALNLYTAVPVQPVAPAPGSYMQAWKNSPLWHLSTVTPCYHLPQWQSPRRRPGPGKLFHLKSGKNLLSGGFPRFSPPRRRIARYKQLSPGLDAYHPLSATRPEEDILIMSQNFDSQQFEACYSVPSYTRWLLELDSHDATLEWHKRVRPHRPSIAPQLLHRSHRSDWMVAKGGWRESSG